MSDAIKSLRPIGIATFVILLGPLVQSDSQVSAQDCHTCTMACPYDYGFYCEPNGGGLGGTEICHMGMVDLPNPIDPEQEGRVDCLCVEQGDICEVEEEPDGFADRTTLVREATDLVAAGGMLPSDGPFYVGRTAEDLVVRWKCDGSIAGRVAIADFSVAVVGVLAG